MSISMLLCKGHASKNGRRRVGLFIACTQYLLCIQAFPSPLFKISVKKSTWNQTKTARTSILYFVVPSWSSATSAYSHILHIACRSAGARWYSGKKEFQSYLCAQRQIFKIVMGNGDVIPCPSPIFSHYIPSPVINQNLWFCCTMYYTQPRICCE